jgi:hypothetical protein
MSPILGTRLPAGAHPTHPIRTPKLQSQSLLCDTNLGLFQTNPILERTRWFKYDRDKLWLVYTQIVPVIFEPPFTSQKFISHLSSSPLLCFPNLRFWKRFPHENSAHIPPIPLDGFWLNLMFEDFSKIRLAQQVLYMKTCVGTSVIMSLWILLTMRNVLDKEL